jgi:hypothetical protein
MGQLNDDSTITAVALDGYEMSYRAADILETSRGTWILAFKRDGEYLPEDPGPVRAVMVGPQTPNIQGHLSARMIQKIVLTGETYQDFSLAVEGLMSVALDRDDIQSCVSCHARSVRYHNAKDGSVTAYRGVPLWRLSAEVDDPRYAPHKQDSSIVSYDGAAAIRGYGVRITASDGFSRTLDSRELHENHDVILATTRAGEPLPEQEAPLILVWDQNASVIPEGIKPIRNVARMEVIFP